MINKTIGRYKILHLIGEGGMACVYEAEHDMLGTKVAIKVLNPILSANAQIKERFRNEAKLMASLNHPNITKVIDFDEQPHQLSIIMEFLEGTDLNQKIKNNGPLTEKEITAIFSQALAAFQYAHEKGIVHRDIKPSNIFILPNGHVKILDFGIAKLFGQGNEMTQTGAQMGTPIYMSPEQVKADKSIDHRSDIYSMGVTMFFAISGKSPYQSDKDSQFVIFTKIVNEPLPHLSNQSMYTPTVIKACNKNREDRFQSCSEWSRAMKKMNDEGDGGKTVLVSGNSFLQKSLLRSKSFWLFIGVLFLAIVLGRSKSKSGIPTPPVPEVQDSVHRKESTGVVEEQVETENKSKEDKQSIVDKHSCLNLLNRWSNMLAEHNINEAEYVYDTKVHYYTQLLSREKVFDNLSAFFENDPSFYQYVYNEVITPLSDGTFKCEFDKHTSMNGKNKVYPSYLIMKYNSMGELKIIHESDYVTDENIAKKNSK